MMDLQPINTGDLIGIAQCVLIWYGLYTMRAGTRQRDKALDEIIAQGQESREALRKSMDSLDKTLKGFDKTLEGLDRTNKGLEKSNDALEKSTEALAVLLKRSA